MSNLSLAVAHWHSLKDGVQAGSGQPLPAENGRINPAEVLAGKKLRNIDPQTIDMLCCFAALSQVASWEPHAAMVSATSMGAFDSVCKLLRESRENALPHQISPGNIPNTVINSTAGLSAIHYGFDGPNISLCANELSFYEALTKAFALMQRQQANDIFVSAVESWQGLYGRSLNPYRTEDNRENLPQLSYAALFMFSRLPESDAVDRVLAVTTGRVLQPADLSDKLASFLFSSGHACDDIEQINQWGVDGQTEALAQLLPGATLTSLSASAKVLMSGLGAWQLAQLLSTVRPGKLAVQLAMDSEGFYGIAIIKKAHS